MWKNCWSTEQKSMKLCICLLIKCWYCFECVHSAIAIICFRQFYFCVSFSAVFLTTFLLLIFSSVTIFVKLVAKNVKKNNLCKIHAFKRWFCIAFSTTRLLQILSSIMKRFYSAWWSFIVTILALSDSVF